MWSPAAASHAATEMDASTAADVWGSTATHVWGSAATDMWCAAASTTAAPSSSSSSSGTRCVDRTRKHDRERDTGQEIEFWHHILLKRPARQEAIPKRRSHPKEAIPLTIVHYNARLGAKVPKA